MVPRFSLHIHNHIIYIIFTLRYSLRWFLLTRFAKYVFVLASCLYLQFYICIFNKLSNNRYSAIKYNAGLKTPKVKIWAHFTASVINNLFAIIWTTKFIISVYFFSLCGYQLLIFYSPLGNIPSVCKKVLLFWGFTNLC